MKRDVVYIVSSICCILIPIIGLLYGYWDNHQPKTGAIGNGNPKSPTVAHWIAMGSSFLAGVLNLPLAILRYRKNKKLVTTGTK